MFTWEISPSLVPTLTVELEIFGIWSDGIILNKFVTRYLGGKLLAVCGPTIFSNLTVYKGGEGEGGGNSWLRHSASAL